jgi:hypothetical protein
MMTVAMLFAKQPGKRPPTSISFGEIPFHSCSTAFGSLPAANDEVRTSIDQYNYKL